MRFTLSILCLLLLGSCFHKNVATDRADDVKTAFIYKGSEGAFIITNESVFQATSKESSGGMTTISGYAEYRITSYDLSTGAQTGRVEMGEGIEKAFVILGATPGKIWVYSIDPDLGLHCRNPKTLAVISDEKALTASGPLKGFAFARPEWSKLDQHYGWNADNRLLMLSDMQGFHYYFDPEKNTLEKTEDEIPDYDWADDETSSSGYFSKEDYVSLRGDGQQKLLFKYEDTTAKFSYLNGELLLDVDPKNAAKRRAEYRESLVRETTAWNDSVKMILQQFPVLADANGGRMRLTEDAYRASWKYDDFKRKLEDIERDKKEAAGPRFEVFGHPLLTDGDGNLFVIHAADVSDTAKMLVTKTQWSGKTFTEKWTVTLPGFFRDPAKADSKGAFETVFSDGNPEFDFQWFVLDSGKLILISQLQMICLDSGTGKILWQKPL